MANVEWALGVAVAPIPYPIFQKWPLVEHFRVHRAMSTATSEVATFANGCFWGTEHMFRKHYGGKGLIDAKVGFIGGTKADPTYMEVCSGQTGHAEASQLTFEPVRIHV